MADLKIKYKDLETAIQLSKEINQELTSSYQTVTIGVPVVAQWLMNPTSNHEVAGSIPDLAQ